MAVLVCLTLIQAQEFNDLVCSGFVEFPPDFNADNFDFSTLEVHLYT